MGLDDPPHMIRQCCALERRCIAVDVDSHPLPQNRSHPPRNTQIQTTMADAADDDLVDYDDDDVVDQAAADDKDAKKGHYVGIHASGFRDFILKPECLRAVVDCGFEHPSEVQHECIPQAVLGMDIICQAKSGMGKTAVFVLATLHQLEPVDGEVSVLVLCHTRELAFQIKNEFDRFSKYFAELKTGVVYGGAPCFVARAAFGRTSWLR